MYKGDSRIIVQFNSDVKIADEFLIVGDDRYAEAVRFNPGTTWSIAFYTYDTLAAASKVEGTKAVIDAGLCWIEGGSWEGARASQRSPRKS